MVKVPLSYSFLERRDACRKFSESLGAGASLAPRTRQRISLGSENDWKFRLRSCQNWKASSLSLGVVVPTSINRYWLRYVGLGRGNLRSHFVFRPRHAPEWLRARFLPVAFLANEEELTGKTFTTSLNTTNPITYVKFIFLRTSPLNEQNHLSYQKLHIRNRLVLLMLLKIDNWSQSLKIQRQAPRVLSRNNAKDSLTISEGAPLAARC